MRKIHTANTLCEHTLSRFLPVLFAHYCVYYFLLGLLLDVEPAKHYTYYRNIGFISSFH